LRRCFRHRKPHRGIFERHAIGEGTRRRRQHQQQGARCECSSQSVIQFVCSLPP
jgi:hypothetical protein